MFNHLLFTLKIAITFYVWYLAWSLFSEVILSTTLFFFAYRHLVSMSTEEEMVLLYYYLVEIFVCFPHLSSWYALLMQNKQLNRCLILMWIILFTTASLLLFDTKLQFLYWLRVFVFIYIFLFHISCTIAHICLLFYNRVISGLWESPL